MEVRGWGAGRDAVFYLQWTGKAWMTRSIRIKYGKKNIPRKENTSVKALGGRAGWYVPGPVKEARVAVAQRWSSKNGSLKCRWSENPCSGEDREWSCDSKSKEKP